MHQLETFAKIITRLTLASVNGQRKPYKPLLLLAVLCEFEKTGSVTEYLVLDDALVARVREVANVVIPQWSGPNLTRSIVAQPYRHLANDFKGTGLWELCATPGQDAYFQAARNGPHRLKGLMGSVAAVRLDPALLAELAASTWVRQKLRGDILAHYADVFAPDAARRLEKYLGTGPMALAQTKFSEGAVESALAAGWRDTPWAHAGVMLEHQLPPFRQHITSDGGRIDLLGYQAAQSAWWVFELKLGRPNDNVIGQTARYMGWLGALPVARNHRVYGAVVAQAVDERLINGVRGVQNLSLWTYDDALNVSQVRT